MVQRCSRSGQLHYMSRGGYSVWLRMKINAFPIFRVSSLRFGVVSCHAGYVIQHQLKPMFILNFMTLDGGLACSGFVMMRVSILHKTSDENTCLLFIYISGLWTTTSRGSRLFQWGVSYNSQGWYSIRLWAKNHVYRIVLVSQVCTGALKTRFNGEFFIWAINL